MTARFVSCVAFQWTPSPDRQNGGCELSRTILTRQAGAGKTCSMFIRSRKPLRWTGRAMRIGKTKRRSSEMGAKRSAEKKIPGTSTPGECVAGFTLIELMVVMAIMLVLLQDLQAMRQAIDNYTLDKEAAPQSLEDLESAGYLRSVPTDPITHAKDW